MLPLFLQGLFPRSLSQKKKACIFNSKTTEEWWHSLKLKLAHLHVLGALLLYSKWFFHHLLNLRAEQTKASECCLGNSWRRGWKDLLPASMKASGRYVKPLSCSRGFPQLACSPGRCRLMIVFKPWLKGKRKKLVVLRVS